MTGAYGLIGNLVYSHLAATPERYETHGMVRTGEPSARTADGSFTNIDVPRLHFAELADFESVRNAVDGMEVVVHLAANPDAGADWEPILSSNIVGTRNVFEASRVAGVRRVIFASSNQVAFGYRRNRLWPGVGTGNDQLPKKNEAGPASGQARHDSALEARVRHDQPVRPMNYYACSKVFGEALAHMYAFRYGLSCISIRIGWVTADDSVYEPSLWCSRRDIVQLIRLCVDAPATITHDVFFGQSANADNFVDIEHARKVLGYEPRDRAEDHEIRRRNGS